MKLFSFGDVKPRDYNYLTFKIIFSVDHEAKAEFLRHLEKILLESIYYKPVDEVKRSFEEIQLLQGKNQSKVLSTWLIKVTKPKKMADFLIKVIKIKFN